MPAKNRQDLQFASDVGERLRSILRLRGLTLSQLSHKSGELFGRASFHFIPHNFYYDLRVGDFSPSIHQLFTLSQITEYRLADWVRVFGADLEDIVRLQVALPSSSTILLDSSLTDPYAWIPWFEERESNVAAPALTLLARLVTYAGYRRIHSLTEKQAGFLYAKIGQQDELAFPDLVPGSIVRVNPNFSAQALPRNSAASSRYFLIAHSRGLSCCRLRLINGDVLVPVSTQLSYPQVELHPREVRLLGVADLEIRPWFRFDPPNAPADSARQWRPRPLARDNKAGPLLRNGRALMHLSLREASLLSEKIADRLGDEHYFISPSSLCDYELANSKPRRVKTIITLCSLYGIELRTILRTLGINLHEAGREPIPDQFLFRGRPIEALNEIHTSIDRTGFVGHLVEQWQEVPFFLRHSLAAVAGLEEVSLEDFLWIGDVEEVLHPYLEHGLLAIVNRRRRRPVHYASKPLCDQPIYLLLRRDGTYMCACCGVENGSLVIHPYSHGFHRADVFRYRQDVEVVGQIVVVARKLT